MDVSTMVHPFCFLYRLVHDLKQFNDGEKYYHKRCPAE